MKLLQAPKSRLGDKSTIRSSDLWVGRGTKATFSHRVCTWCEITTVHSMIDGRGSQLLVVVEDSVHAPKALG